MANQIAANFRHHPDDQAAGEVAAHLRSFWTPWMLERLDAVVAAGGAGLDPLVVAALLLLQPPAA